MRTSKWSSHYISFFGICDPIPWAVCVHREGCAFFSPVYNMNHVVQPKRCEERDKRWDHERENLQEEDERRLLAPVNPRPLRLRSNSISVTVSLVSPRDLRPIKALPGVFLCSLSINRHILLPVPQPHHLCILLRSTISQDAYTSVLMLCTGTSMQHCYFISASEKNANFRFSQTDWQVYKKFALTEQATN